MTRREFFTFPLLAAAVPQASSPAALGTRRELFLDRHLIADLQGAAELRLAAPLDSGTVFQFDRPREGAFSAYSTVIRDGGTLRLYYRGIPSSGSDGQEAEVTCVAESHDGTRFTRVPVRDERNVILEHAAPFSHNFCPFLDTRPGTPESQRYKAIAGIHKSGLHAFVSRDGIAWQRLQAGAVLPSPKEFAFDSQNIAFFSPHEGKYVLYFRTWKEIGKTKYRWISRAWSDDFTQWTVEGPVDFGGAPPEHLYTNQTSPYFRAPHIYLGICARFFPGKQVLSEAQARAIHVDPDYFKDCSDAVLVTSRGGTRFSRTFLEAFVRPGLGMQNWVSRSNYPALNVVQTGEIEMSFYVNRNYGQPSAHLQRYALRLDGFASLHAGYAGGSLLTHPLTFDGSQLELNYSTSAAGSVRVELLDDSGRPLEGFSGADVQELVGDEVSRMVSWRAKGTDLSVLRGRVVRLRFSLTDGDVYSFRFVA